MALGKGIPVINAFDLNSKLPLDSRAVADTMEDMNKLVTDESVGDGQLCYCKADKKLYVLKDNVWSEVGGGGGGIPVVEGTITSENTFALNETPTGNYFLAHLLYPGTTIYLNSLMTKTTVTFGNETTILYIGLIDLQGAPFLAFTVPSDDGSAAVNTLKQISFMNSAYQSNGIIYLANNGFDSLEYGESGTFLKSTGDGVVWDTPSAGGGVSVTFED